MTLSAEWRPLNVEERVPLFVRSCISKDSYSILITDLSSVWSQSLNKSDILKQALQSSTSIDPSEDDGQLLILLDKIRQALNGEDETKLDLCQGAKADGLLIVILSPLPAQLPPLEWHIDLEQLPREAIATEFVVPLLSQAQQCQRQVRQLIRELIDKDHVISKLTDRFESSGADLTAVFPGVSNIKVSQKRSQREQLAKHVKGLAEFDEYMWREQQSPPHHGADISQDIFADGFADLPTAKGLTQVGPSWWTRLPTSYGSSVRSSQKQTNVARVNQCLASDADAPHGSHKLEQQPAKNDDDGEFQTQDLPSHLIARHSDVETYLPMTEEPSTDHADTHVVDTKDDATTDDEDDLDAPPVTRKPSFTSQRATVGSSTKDQATLSRTNNLGMIGGSLAPAQTSTDTGDISVDTDNVIHSDNSAKSRKPLSPDPGTKSESWKPSQVPAAELEPVRVASQALSAGSKLGRIGGKKVDATGKSPLPLDTPRGAEPNVAPYDRSSLRSSHMTKPAAPQPSVTPAERADNKRMELKRELEAKAQAPVKKKRKF